MKKTILFLFIFSSFYIAKAQKQDTTIYSNCRLANDTTHYIAVDNQYVAVDKEIIFDSCPQFKNGFNDLFKYISAHIRYPIISKENYIQGKVIISCIIEKDGKVSHSKIEHSPSVDLNPEALRVINSLPKWKPGILHGKPVRVKYYIVVSFKPYDRKPQ
jgi:protein TonB